MENNKQFEINLYEHLGVRQFQKLVFKLEKFIHFKDKQKNINYHVKSDNIDDLNSFKKFLYYNGAIHVRNAIGVTALIILQPLFFSKWTLVYLVPSLIKNLYCVMLQRYNYLRINKVIEGREKQIDKRVEKRKESFSEAANKQLINIKDKQTCLTQIENVKKFLQGQEDVFLDSTSIESLRLIKSFLTENYDKEAKEEKNSLVKKIGGKYYGK